MPDFDTGTILIVEDEAELRSLLVAHMRSTGFEVLEAANGSDAIEIATSRLPDLILLDIGLPGMDGLSVTRSLRSADRTADIPVILLTARASTKDVIQGLDAGAQEYIAKPFDVMELLARVRTVYRLARSRKDLDRLNTQLEAEVDAKTRKLRLLYEFMRDLNHAATRQDVFDRIIRCAQEISGAQRISLLIRDENSGNLVCERAVGIDPAVAERINFPANEGIAGGVFLKGKTLVARTYGANPGNAPAYSGDSFLSTPLISTTLGTEDGMIGVLNVTERNGDSPFAEDEIECLRSIADAAAIALDNIVRRTRLQHSVRVLLQTVGLLAEYRDEETALHLERVTLLARILTTELKRQSPYQSLISEDFVSWIVQAAPMHDIGKVGIPDDILTKPGKLTDEEFQIMKTHTDIGRRVLSRALDPAHPVPQLQMCIDIAYCHHERWDGKGYPRRLAGDQIPLSARIIALVDAYDAMTSRRRYKPAKSHEDAVEVIRAESGRHFDAVLVAAFLRCHERFDAVRARYADAGEPVGAMSG